ncbi:MAG: outer membrane protein transport protein [Acidobacteriota bacterium]|nr:outer membrane protein transport protein [Acidobacteriota bacterium]
MRIRKSLTAATLCLAACALVFEGGLNAQGSRAAAMGGAYVGLVDDFSAFYWNPAGLARITGKTFGFYGADILPTGSYKYSRTYPAPIGTVTLADAKTLTKNYIGGLAGYVQPLTENLVVGLGIYTPPGLGAAWDGEALAALSGGATDLDWKSRMGLITFAPTIAYRLNDILSFGASLNINVGTFALSSYTGAYGDLIDLSQYTESETGLGLGATLGLQFQPHRMVRLGLVYRTASKVGLSGTAEISRLTYLGLASQSDVDRTITWPASLAGGLAFMPTGRLTISADVQYTNWGRIQSLDADYADSAWSQIMAATGRDTIPMRWRDTVQVRLGGEYKVSSALAVRAGWHNDPSPAPDETMNLLLPTFDFNALTLGLGYRVADLSLDFGLEYLMGAERTISADSADAVPGVYNMKILVPTMSVHYKF